MTAFVVLGVSTPLENVHTAKIPAYPPVQRDHPGSNQRRDALLRAGGAIAKPRLGPGAQPGRSVIR